MIDQEPPLPFARLVCQDGTWSWEVGEGETIVKTAGPFGDAIDALDHLMRKVGHTTPVEALRRQLKPTARECVQAASLRVGSTLGP